MSQDSDQPQDARVEMAAVVVHQLRNRMSRVLFGTEAIIAGSAQLPQLNAAATRLRKGIDELIATFDQLIELARLLAGDAVERAERVNLGALVERSVERKRALFRALEQVLDVAVPAEPLWVDVDRLAMELAVESLLTNAAKFTPQRGHVWVRVAVQDGQAAVTVRDDGIGIERDRLSHLFEGRPAPRPRGQDTPRGISAGLLLVHRIAQLHGGLATIDSPGPGGGTEACLRVPCVAQPVRTDGWLPRALVVQSQPAITAALLRSWGYHVAVEADANAALAVARTFAPSLVLVAPTNAADDAQLAARLRAATPARLLLVGGDGRTPGFDRTVPAPVDVDVLHAAVLGV